MFWASLTWDAFSYHVLNGSQYLASSLFSSGWSSELQEYILGSHTEEPSVEASCTKVLIPWGSVLPSLYLLCPVLLLLRTPNSSQGSALANSHAARESVTHSSHSRKREKKRGISPRTPKSHLLPHLHTSTPESTREVTGIHLHSWE